MDKRGASVDAKIKQLDAELARHREILRTCRTPAAKEAAKRRALQVLKQRRLYEGQREQLYNQQYNVEQISFAAQSAKDTAVQVSAMQASAKELKKQFNSKAFDVDKLDALNDEMADLMDQSREIQDVLGRSYDVPEDIDEEELMGELDALEEIMGEEERSDEEVPSYLRDEALPDAPDGTQEALPATGEGARVTVATEPAQKSAAQ